MDSGTSWWQGLTDFVARKLLVSTPLFTVSQTSFCISDKNL
jgi:hypothetical protein